MIGSTTKRKHRKQCSRDGVHNSIIIAIVSGYHLAWDPLDRCFGASHIRTLPSEEGKCQRKLITRRISSIRSFNEPSEKLSCSLGGLTPRSRAKRIASSPSPCNMACTACRCSKKLHDRLGAICFLRSTSLNDPIKARRSVRATWAVGRSLGSLHNSFFIHGSRYLNSPLCSGSTYCRGRT
jgi:hypothetical protein